MSIPNVSSGNIQQFAESLSGMFGNGTQSPVPHVLVSMATVNLVTTIAYTYVMPAFFVCGTIGNALSLVVLCATKNRNTTTMILIALAVSDLGFISTTFARLVSFIFRYFDATLARNYRAIMLAQMSNINTMFSRITNLITTLISMERFTAVIIPLKVNAIFTQQRVIIILVAIYVGTFSLMFPAFFAGGSRWVVNPLTNVSFVIYYQTKFYTENREFWSIYGYGFLNFFLRLLPCVIVGFNSAAIIIKLKRAKRWRQDTSKSSNQKSSPRDDKLTKMLVTICGIFSLCSLPGFIINILGVVSTEYSFYGKYRNTFNLFSVLSNIFGYFNSSINFVVYMTLNSRFVKTFKDIFGCQAKET